METEGNLIVKLSELQFNHLVSYILKEYEAYGPISNTVRPIFSKLASSSELYTGPQKNSIIPFKKILLPNGRTTTEPRPKKIALLGLFNCDVWALRYFLEEFEKTDLMPDSSDIFVMAKECHPDDNCFCDLMGTDRPATADLFIQHERSGFSVFAESSKGKELLTKLGLKPEKKPIEKRLTKIGREKFDQKKITDAVDNKEKFAELWGNISENCFGCGACSAVCPLCFCFRQDFQNQTDGSCKNCLSWDSCFAKRFSEIQHHVDLRPDNSDRLYNWYHHKFVRAQKERKRPLCTGCGRCIEACPANLNINGILKSIIQQNEEKK